MQGLALFQNGVGWLCPISQTLNNYSQELKNYFCFGCRLIPRMTAVNWKAKLERAHFLSLNLVK